MQKAAEAVIDGVADVEVLRGWCGSEVAVMERSSKDRVHCGSLSFLGEGILFLF